MNIVVAKELYEFRTITINMDTTFDCFPADSLAVYLPIAFILVVTAIGDIVFSNQSRNPDAKEYAIFRIKRPNFKSPYREKSHPILKYIVIFASITLFASFQHVFYDQQFELTHGYHLMCNPSTFVYYISLNFGIVSALLFVRSYLMSDERKLELEYWYDIHWYMKQYETYIYNKGKPDGFYLTENGVKFVELFTIKKMTIT